MRGQNRSAEGDGIAIMQYAINLCGLPMAAVMEIALPACLDNWYIRFHDHEFSSSQAFHQRAAGGVIVMCMADEEYLDVAKFEAQLFYCLADHRNGFLKAAVNENVPFAGRDEIGGQLARAHVIDIADDLVRWKRFVPLRVGCQANSGGAQDQYDTSKHPYSFAFCQMAFPTKNGPMRSMYREV